MPEKSTMARARRDKRQGKSASTQAGEFVQEEIRTIRKGQHGARNAKQAIAIGLSKARRAGVKLKAPAKGQTSKTTRKKAQQDLKKGQSTSSRRRAPSPTRSRAAKSALKKESSRAASHRSLARHARQAARSRGPAARSRAAQKAARTRRHRM